MHNAVSRTIMLIALLLYTTIATHSSSALDFEQTLVPDWTIRGAFTFARIQYDSPAGFGESWYREGGGTGSEKANHETSLITFP